MGIDAEKKVELMKIILDIAKERMEEVSHLNVGNYCSEIYTKIMNVLEKNDQSVI